MPTRNLTISNLWQLVTVDANNLPLKVKNTYIPPPTIDGLSLGGVKQGTNITITADGTISATGGGGGGGTLQSLTDVSVVEPSFIDTANRITAFNLTTLFVSSTPPLLLSVGDWIRGDVIANSPVVQITAISDNAITVATTTGFGFLTPGGDIYKISSVTLSGFALTWDVATNKWIAKAQSYGTIQNAIGTVMQRPAVQFVGSGVTSVADDPANNRTIVTITGGGGGGSFVASAVWTGGTSNKDAYTSPGVVNNQGITISLVASAGSGGITAATISLNGTALLNTYTSTTTWPNLTITIPVADLIGNGAEVASTVAISIIGTFSGGGTNISNAGTLTTNQPIPFATTLSGSYNVSSLPYYTTTATLNYSYSNSGAITTFAGVFTPGGSASGATGSFPNIASSGSAISGSATGAGSRGAGTSTVNFAGSVPAVPSYIPAFYNQTLNNTPPTFSTASTQTARAAQGSIITYPLPSAFTNYNWVCTQRPLANLVLRTVFGDSPLVPDVTAPNQTISGQIFQVYGWTSLSINAASILVIS